MRPIQSMIAMLFALGASGALAQNAAAPQPPTGKPVSDSATFGPVLNPQAPPAATGQQTQATTRATPQAAGEARPQAQEERAGSPPVTGKQNEVDPSARPAPAQPQTPQPQTQLERQGGTERRQDARKGRQAQRRPGAVQQIEPTARIVAPNPAPVPGAQARIATPPVAPQSTQVMGCMGSTCTDVNGTTYNASGPGNATVSSNGRLCTRSGATMQCF